MPLHNFTAIVNCNCVQPFSHLWLLIMHMALI